jgi:hypothetical protein
VLLILLMALATSARAQVISLGAIASLQSIDWNGNDVLVDSFDSTDPAYSNSGLYDPAKAKDGGDLIANGWVSNAVAFGNQLIYGHAAVGPGDPVSVGTNGGLGEHTWVAAHPGQIEPGWVTQNANFTIATPVMPYGATNPSVLVPRSGTFVVTNFTIASNLVTTATYPNPPPPGGVTTNFHTVTTLTWPNVPGTITTNCDGVLQKDKNFPAVPYCINPPPLFTSHGNNASFWSWYGIASYSYISNDYSYTLYTTNYTVTSDSYDYVLYDGDYYLGSALTGRTLVVGQAWLVLPQGVNMGGDDNLIIAPTGSLQMFLGKSSSISGLGIANQTGLASRCGIFCTYQVNSLSLRNSGTFAGLVVAPSTSVGLSAPGTNPVDFIGRIVANGVQLFAGSYRFHFDEALARTSNGAPQIIKSPSDRITLAGGNGVFTVTVDGQPSQISLQWWSEPSDFSQPPALIPGETNSLLDIPAIDGNPLDPDFSYTPQRYFVRVSNGTAVATSSSALLTVLWPPIITKQPVSQPAFAGSDVTLSADILRYSDPPLSFQWRLNGTPLPSATSNSLALANLQSNNAGAYDVVVSNHYGTVTSQVATVSLTLPPTYSWAQSASNSTPYSQAYGPSVAQSIATDSSGNVTVGGYFKTLGLDFGSGVVLSNASGFVAKNFIAKYDSNGNPLWAVPAGTNSGGMFVRVATDSSGNAYLAGKFSGSLTFGTNTLVSKTAADTFIAKFATNGQVIWANQIGATTYYSLLGFGFAADSSGNTFIADRDLGTADFGSVVLSNSTAFLACFDTNGALAWAEEAPGAAALALGTNGTIFLTGSGLLAKYDSLGDPIWSRTFPNGDAIAIDADQNQYITGYGTGTFDGFTLTNTSGGQDFFVAKCNRQGQVQWMRQVGSIYGQVGTGICVDRYGDVFVSSLSANKRVEPSLSFDGITITNVMGFVAEFDSSGRALWALAPAGGGTSFWAISPASVGSVYAGGEFWGSVTFGSVTLIDNHWTPTGEMFLVQLGGITPSPARLMNRSFTQNQFQFDVSAVSGFNYIVETSTNLVDWSPVSTNVSPFTFIDQNVGNQPINYYRAVHRP